MKQNKKTIKLEKFNYLVDGDTGYKEGYKLFKDGKDISNECEGLIMVNYEVI